MSRLPRLEVRAQSTCMVGCGEDPLLGCRWSFSGCDLTWEEEREGQLLRLSLRALMPSRGSILVT